MHVQLANRINMINTPLRHGQHGTWQILNYINQNLAYQSATNEAAVVSGAAETEDLRGRIHRRHPETYTNHIYKQRPSIYQSYSPRKTKTEKPKERTSAKKTKLLCTDSCSKKKYNSKFTEEERQILFDSCRKMGYSQKQKQIVGNMTGDKERKQERENTSQNRNWQLTKTYYQGDVSVCKTVFLQTFL